jgi:hypothetical protein
MMPLSIRLSLLAVGALGVAACLVVPQSIGAARWLASEHDPVALADLGLQKTFDATAARREIEAALTADDAELAESFVALAHDQGVALDPALVARVEARQSGTAVAAHSVGQFVRGFVVGEPDDLASLAGTATGDLFVFGDARDAAREGTRLVRGEAADEMILGLACVGLAVTAGTYATLGAAAPARVGLSVMKAARKTGRLGTQLSGAVARAVRETVDTAALRQGLGHASLLHPVAALRAAREAVKVEKAGGLMHLVRDVGRVQSKAGTRAALDGLKLADSPKDVARLARLAEGKGLKTRAIIKLLGRGAIMLTGAVLNLAWWLLVGLINLIGLVVAVKRAAERVALRVIRNRKLRRLQAFRPIAAAPQPV